MDAERLTKSRVERLGTLSSVFCPSAPVSDYQLFAGRIQQMTDVVTAVFQKGQHVILFGERGVGKTSLAGVVAEVLTTHGQERMESRTVNCDVDDDFSSLWHKALRELSTTREMEGGHFGPLTFRERVPLGEYMKRRRIAPDDIRWLLSQHPAPRIIIIDEVDRLQDKTTTALLADTIKTLSDHSVNATLILVGVADAVDGLLAQHKSIERALVQVRMQRMSDDELSEIIHLGLDELRMTIKSEAKALIISLSKGLPHYTHLLAFHAAYNAIQDDADEIMLADVQAAVAKAVEKIQQSVLSAYLLATSTHRKDALHEKVLLACALAQTDPLGYFSAADVRRPLSRIRDKRCDIPTFAHHLHEFCKDQRGPVLQQTGQTRRIRYRFADPLMQPFVIFHGLSQGWISPTDIWNLALAPADAGDEEPPF